MNTIQMEHVTEAGERVITSWPPLPPPGPNGERDERAIKEWVARVVFGEDDGRPAVMAQAQRGCES